MAGLDYRRRRMFTIYAVAIMLILCALILTACNADRGTFDVSGETVSEPTHFIAKLMYGLNENIKIFGWTVIVFTVILKLVLSPLDIWQRVVSRRNAKAMERMRPQLEALAEKYGDDKQRYQQEQMALYKKEKYSMLGACLPSLVTIIVFIVIFAGFREMVGYQFAQDYKQSYNVFETAMTEYFEGEDYESLEMTQENAERYADAVEIAQQKVYDFYFSAEQVEARKFLWIHNIFVSDSWKEGVPNYLVVTGQEGFAMSKITGVMKDEYELVMGKVIGADLAGYGSGAKWNGLLLLPVFSIVLSFLSQKLLTKSQGTPPPSPNGKSGDSMQANMKMMQYFMPIMIGVFALFYSAAFALYTFTSSLVAIVFQLIFALVGKILDKREERMAGGFASSRRK